MLKIEWDQILGGVHLGQWREEKKKIRVSQVCITCMWLQVCYWPRNWPTFETLFVRRLGNSSSLIIKTNRNCKNSMARETTIFGWPFTADKWAAVFFSFFLPVYLLLGGDSLRSFKLARNWEPAMQFVEPRQVEIKRIQNEAQSSLENVPHTHTHTHLQWGASEIIIIPGEKRKMRRASAAASQRIHYRLRSS